MSICCVMLGLIIAVRFSTDGSPLGVLLVLLASLCGSLKWVLIQKLITSAPQCTNIFFVIYYFSPAAVMFLLPIGLYLELPRLLQSQFVNNLGVVLQTLCGAGTGGFTGFALIAFEIYVLRASSSVSLGILGQIKEVRAVYSI